jgi:Stage II sporulation protein E (SpoIIE)
VLARADRYLTGELGDGFATVIICCYEHATAKLTWAKAGHEPSIIAGQTELEEEPATPLGFGLGDTWPQFSHSSRPVNASVCSPTASSKLAGTASISDGRT